MQESYTIIFVFEPDVQRPMHGRNYPDCNILFFYFKQKIRLNIYIFPTILRIISKVSRSASSRNSAAAAKKITTPERICTISRSPRCNEAIRGCTPHTSAAYMTAVTNTTGSNVRTNRHSDNGQYRVVATALSTSSIAAIATIPHTIAVTLWAIVTTSTAVMSTRLTISSRTTIRPSLKALRTL